LEVIISLILKLPGYNPIPWSPFTNASWIAFFIILYYACKSAWSNVPFEDLNTPLFILFPIECQNIRQLTIYMIFLPDTPVILSAITVQLYATIISAIAVL
jgi:hypothetical protein